MIGKVSLGAAIIISLLFGIWLGISISHYILIDKQKDKPFILQNGEIKKGDKLDTIIITISNDSYWQIRKEIGHDN